MKVHCLSYIKSQFIYKLYVDLPPHTSLYICMCAGSHINLICT